MNGVTFDAFMKKFLLTAATVLSLGLASAFAQFGPHGGGQGPQFNGALDKLFGDNQSFSATLEFQTTSAAGDSVTMPGKVNYDGGKARFEMNLSETQGSKMPPETLAQMKSMGMDNTITIWRPDLKADYFVYPGLNSYAEMQSGTAAASTNLEDYKMETSETGKDTVDGHDCVKNKTSITDKDNNKHEYTVWDATDLKNFPVKIITNDGSRSSTMLFKNVTFTKSASSNFETPTGFTKYDNVETMLRTEPMKHIGGALGRPPEQ